MFLFEAVYRQHIVILSSLRSPYLPFAPHTCPSISFTWLNFSYYYLFTTFFSSCFLPYVSLPCNDHLRSTLSYYSLYIIAYILGLCFPSQILPVFSDHVPALCYTLTSYSSDTTSSSCNAFSLYNHPLLLQPSERGIQAAVSADNP